MTNKVVVEKSGSVGILGLLGVLFIALKLTGFIDWPWIWVLAPFWIGIALFLLIAMFIILVAVLVRR